MLGLKSLFTALARLVASVNAMADTFDRANEALFDRLALSDEPAQIETTPTEARNGRTAKMKS